MKTTTRLVIAIIIIILFNDCNHSRQDNHQLTIQINSIKKLNQDTLKDISDIYYSINFDLKNNTDSTVYFWIMNCTWDDNFIYNIENVYVMNPFNCSRNFPTVDSIERNQFMNFKGVIGAENKDDLKKELRLGFIYIKENEKSRLNEILPSPPVDSIITRVKPKNIIWSEPFEIKE